MFVRDVVDKVVVEQRAAIVRRQRSFENSGVGVEDCYHDVVVTHLEDTDEMQKPITDGEAKLLEARLPRELNRDTRQACQRWFRYWDDDPKRRELYDTLPDDDNKRLPEVQAVEVEISERVRESEERRLDTLLLLGRLPDKLARTVELRIEGYTLPEMAAKLEISEWNVRSDFQDATTTLKRLVKLEGRLAPREHVESPRHKAAREEIERSCAQLRPKATKPTLCQGKKLDPRSFWYSKLTIDFFDWEKELAARMKRGERFPYAKPKSSGMWPAAMMEWPLISITHKMYDLSLMSEQLGFTPTLKRKRRCRQVIQFADAQARKRALAKASTCYPMLPQPYCDPTVALAA